MPKFSLLLGRSVIRSFDLDQPRIRVGRGERADILIDNASISRDHAEFRRQGDGWVVEDLNSANGTFVDGKRIYDPRPVETGDEIALGKFSILFGTALEPDTAQKSRTSAAPPDPTVHIKPHEVKELLAESRWQREAHLVWESGGRSGTHYLADIPAALFGTDDLCDVQVPEGPEHHLLITLAREVCEARNLHKRAKMTLNGKVVRRTGLMDGDVVEMKGLTVRFVGRVEGDGETLR